MTKKLICSIAIIVVVAVIVIVVVLDPVSLNCRRACAHVEGDGWRNCMEVCER